MAASDRALAALAAFETKRNVYVVTRGSFRLVFDELPTPVLDKQGQVVGVSVMVRLFDGLTEVRIDPHRVIINPPTVPRANLTYVDSGATDARGELLRDKYGELLKRRVVGVPNPEAALVEALWDSIDGTPNAKGWRA